MVTSFAFAQTSTEVDIQAGAGASANAACVATNSCFSPNPITVPQGAEVEWKNQDTVSHTITSGKVSDDNSGSLFDSGLIKKGSDFKFTFLNSGTFDYFCTVHPWMTGQVIVGTGHIAPPAPVLTPSNEVDIQAGAGASASAACVATNNCFSPNPITVPPGTEVEWKNTDTVSHTVTSGKASADNAGSLFDSGLIKNGADFKFTFATAGTYDYFCTVHPWMSGQVIVGSGSPPAPVPTPPMNANEIDIQPGAGSSASATCVATNDCFSPNPITVSQGTEVEWKNGDTVSHTVTSGKVSDNNAGSLFDSGLIKKDSDFKYTFETAGTFDYFCTVHPWMTGQVVVTGGQQGQENEDQPKHGGVAAEQQEQGQPEQGQQQDTHVILNPTEQDLKSIDDAKNNQTIAAEVNVGANSAETKSIDSNVQVQSTENTPDSLGVKVTADNQTGPKVIAFNLAATTINVANLKDLGVMYDGKLIPPAANMDAILHAKPTDSPSFAIVVTQSGVQVLVLIPHFSTHSITITNMSKVIPTVPEFPFAMLALIIATFTIVLIPKVRHF